MSQTRLKPLGMHTRAHILLNNYQIFLKEYILTQWFSQGKALKHCDTKKNFFILFFHAVKRLSQVCIISYFLHKQFILFKSIKLVFCEVYYLFHSTHKPSIVFDSSLWFMENAAVAAAAKSLQSCPTLCNPVEGSPPGSSWYLKGLSC